MDQFLCVLVTTALIKIQGLFATSAPIHFNNEVNISSTICDMRYCSARGGSCAFSDTDLICCKCRCNSNTRYFASYGRCVRPDLVTKVPTAQRSTVNSLNTTTATLVLTSSKASNTSFSTSTAAITTLEDLVTTAGGFTSTTMTITPAGFSTASKKNHSTWKSTTISITTRSTVAQVNTSQVPNVKEKQIITVEFISGISAAIAVLLLIIVIAVVRLNRRENQRNKKTPELGFKLKTVDGDQANDYDDVISGAAASSKSEPNYSDGLYTSPYSKQQPRKPQSQNNVYRNINEDPLYEVQYGQVGIDKETGKDNPIYSAEEQPYITLLDSQDVSKVKDSDNVYTALKNSSDDSAMYHPLQVSGKPNAGSKGVDVGSTEETDNSSEEKRYEDLKSLAKQDVYQSLTAS